MPKFFKFIASVLLLKLLNVSSCICHISKRLKANIMENIMFSLQKKKKKKKHASHFIKIQTEW